METRANYVLIGAVTLAGIVGIFAFFLWYARVQIDRSYDYYDILFDTVTGLNQASDVRFNGITVGQVLAIQIDPGDGAQVRVGIEVRGGTPINSATVATLQAQGVTGVSFVALTSSNPAAPPLPAGPDGGPPIIPSTPSVLDTLIEGAPELLREATELLRGLSSFVTPDNQNRVSGILANVEAASAGLNTALTDFSAISASVRDGVSQISAFTSRLDGIATQLDTTLATGDTTLAAATGAFDEARGTLAAATGALQAAQTTLRDADDLILDRAPALIDGYEAAARSVTGLATDLGARTGDLVTRLETATDLASARLREAEAPLAAATPALTAVETAANNLDVLTTGEGTELIADLRDAAANVNRLIETDAAPILADVRAAAATVNQVSAAVGADLTALSGRLDGVVGEAETALSDASATFRTANAALQAIEPAVATATRALGAAEGAFASADRVMSTEIEPIAADVRRAVAALEGAIAQVSADLPAITAEVRAAAESAARAADRIEATVAAGAPGVQTFAANGLPQFTRLGQDARGLVATLEDLIRRIERDPARFFLGGRPPEYRP